MVRLDLPNSPRFDLPGEVVTCATPVQKAVPLQGSGRNVRSSPGTPFHTVATDASLGFWPVATKLSSVPSSAIHCASEKTQCPAPYGAPVPVVAPASAYDGGLMNSCSTFAVAPAAATRAPNSASLDAVTNG